MRKSKSVFAQRCREQQEEEKNKDQRHVLAILVSRHLSVLSECSEQARGKACVSHRSTKLLHHEGHEEHLGGVVAGPVYYTPQVLFVVNSLCIRPVRTEIRSHYPLETARSLFI
jgi:hypothetical protein